ncbi:MAG: RNA polymerase sigma factor [Planctomycetes bacterium]|nr:RNA polymerase sigma factor [Planctomycetota bacterium]
MSSDPGVRAGDSDEALVARLEGGDPAALRQLMERYRGPLHGYLCRLLGSSDDADDLFQDTFVRVLRHAARFDRGRSFRPWLYSIATNLARNTFRSRSYRDAVPLDRPDEDGCALVAQLAGRGGAPGDAAERSEAAGVVRAAVDELPEKGRAAVVLFYYQGLSYDEIAEALEIPVGTVKSRMHNAMTRLARALAPQEELP